MGKTCRVSSNGNGRGSSPEPDYANRPRTGVCALANGKRSSLPLDLARGGQPWHAATKMDTKGKNTMLYTIAVILIILWLLGLLTAYSAGGLIHILLVIAVIAILLRIIRGGRIL